MMRVLSLLLSSFSIEREWEMNQQVAAGRRFGSKGAKESVGFIAWGLFILFMIPVFDFVDPHVWGKMVIGVAVVGMIATFAYYIVGNLGSGARCDPALGVVCLDSVHRRRGGRSRSTVQPGARRLHCGRRPDGGSTARSRVPPQGQRAGMKTSTIQFHRPSPVSIGLGLWRSHDRIVRTAP